MWSRPSNKPAAAAGHVHVPGRSVRASLDPSESTTRRPATVLGGVLLLAILAACSVAPPQADHAWTKITAAHPASGDLSRETGKAPQPGTGRGAPNAPGSAQPGQGGHSGQSGPSGQGIQAAAGPPPVPPEATAAFDKALALARAGSNDAAETQLDALARQYPQFSTPLVDLGILYRKGGNLDAAARALQQAVARDPHEALAWTELGVVQRLSGKFQDAEQSYSRAIAADPAYAPAYRDRGVLRDLYLDQPAAALADFEQYRKLAADDKPVVMWIAELQHRTGVKAPPQARN